MDTLDEARRRIDDIDEKLADLYRRRMEAVSAVADVKEARGLPIYDPSREADIVARGCARLEDEALREGFAAVLRTLMAASRQYQATRRPFPAGQTLTLRHAGGVCPITVARGGLTAAADRFGLDRDTFILTDSGVPPIYAQTAAGQVRGGHRAVIHTIPQGEGSKTPQTLLTVLSAMAEAGFDRTACVVGVGGGVVCDMAGLAASLYMRGIDHFFVPTTLLCMIDAGIGGKTAVDFGGVKNLIGTFRQPQAVLIDPALLSTLPAYELACGMAEAIKAALLADADLFDLFDTGDPFAHLDEIILRAADIKRRIVEADETEHGMRRLLNLGHTLGHGIEAAEGGRMGHGACVALGMLPMVSPALRSRLIPILERLGLPTAWDGSAAAAMAAISHDKKATARGLTVVTVDRPGQPGLQSMSLDELRERLALLSGARA